MTCGVRKGDVFKLYVEGRWRKVVATGEHASDGSGDLVIVWPRTRHASYTRIQDIKLVRKAKRR